MSGSRESGRKAAETNKKKYGKDFYANIGRKGGSKSHPETRYFAMHPEVAKNAGAKGGAISRRGSTKDIRAPHIKDEWFAK